MQRDLPSLDAEAVARVRQHCELLGDNGEQWISDGVQYVFTQEACSADLTCPFCGQSISGVELIDRYRAYFGEAYASLQQEISSTISLYTEELSGDVLSATQQTFSNLIEQYNFWRSFVDLPSLDIKWEQISGTWIQLRNELLAVLTRKQAAPLTSLSMSDDLREKIGEFNDIMSCVKTQVNELTKHNKTIDNVKKSVESGDLNTVTAEFNHLKATQSRYSVEVSQPCKDYLRGKADKIRAEQEKAEVREELDRHRQSIFPRYLESLNNILSRFGAGFRIEQLTASDAAGQPSVMYCLSINNEQVALADQEAAEAGPCFGNTLSSGDRNTLALAFFLASLEHESNLAESIIVLDDPVSSLDDGRITTTIEEIRELVPHVKQAIILSHCRPLLCDIWDHSDKNNTSALKLIRGPNNSSDLVTWDVSTDVLTEYDKRHKALREYQQAEAQSRRYVAQCLRPVMEKYLRITFPEYCVPGTLLGTFLNHVRNLVDNGQRIMSDQDICELSGITEYANKFHHDTNPAWQTEEIRDNELRIYVTRVLNFTKHGTPDPNS